MVTMKDKLQSNKAIDEDVMCFTKCKLLFVFQSEVVGSNLIRPSSSISPKLALYSPIQTRDLAKVSSGFNVRFIFNIHFVFS